ncbi:MAG: pre-mRNA cleavage and polyadenylation factor (CPF) complex subunit [Trizodia sp. TS-e1964]|nr:MAG: pre-mRNA cleavage and polyadenylation factor (CPF) complex subunit [Trizodia sp. TS-e1964]
MAAGSPFPTLLAKQKRPITDFGVSLVNWTRDQRPKYQDPGWEMERPSPSYLIDMLPPSANPGRPVDSLPAKHLHSSLNKIRHPINVVRWTPEGRRLLTASSSGEFTLWNGMGFNFETIMQAHDSAIRAARYSHSDDWLLSADQDGIIKYWQTNFNNVKVIQGHSDPIRDVAFSPADTKFVTASDDSTLKIFDFAGGIEESVLTGHGWDAKSVDWHPTKGLLVSGSKDHLVKLWDPRTGRCLTTLHGHKNAIQKVLFEPTKGQMLATCARDSTARVFDLRMMRDVVLLRGHEKDISTIIWHPIHRSLLSTSGSDGSIFHYLLDEPHTPEGSAHTLSPYDTPDPSIAPAQPIYPAHRVTYAHDMAVWSMDWHPVGHILASGSNDRITRFWTRPRPGDDYIFDDRYHIGESAAEAKGTWDRRGGRRQMRDEEDQEVEDEADGLVDQKMPLKLPSFPGIPGLPMPSGGLEPPPSIPGMGHIPPLPLPQGIPLPPPYGLPLDSSNMPDLSKLAALMKDGTIPMPPFPIPTSSKGLPPPPPLPANFPPGLLPPGLLPPGFQIPIPGFQGGIPPPPPGFIPNSMKPNTGNDMNEGPVASGIRKRGPLPSQQESLAEEQRRGKYRPVR